MNDTTTVDRQTGVAGPLAKEAETTPCPNFERFVVPWQLPLEEAPDVGPAEPGERRVHRGEPAAVA